MKQWIRSTAQAALKSSAWKQTSRWLRGHERWDALELEYDGSYVDAEVVVYFGDRRSKFYQLSQWIPVLEELHKYHKVVIVLRKPSALLEALEHTSLPLVLKRRFDPLQTFYHANDFVLALYVNNGMTNFQSLSYSPMVHVHVNHGESDKLSMVSNQAKAYDKVFVAGDAAIDRHRKALLDFDLSTLVKVGRPQLDIERELELPSARAQTVMYAPTWEGENDANNYTSVDVFGPQIVEAALDTPNVRLVYKPHPRVEKSADDDVRLANDRILELIESRNASIDDDSLKHQVLMQGDILAMFPTVDLLITDVSSVGLDFLYLSPEKPLILTDRRDDLATLNDEAPISRSTTVISGSVTDKIGEIIQDNLSSDHRKEDREKMRTYYFGAGAKGASTALFQSAVDDLILRRREQLKTFTHFDTSMEASDESMK